jgi:hypothetical protein
VPPLGEVWSLSDLYPKVTRRKCPNFGALDPVKTCFSLENEWNSVVRRCIGRASWDHDRAKGIKPEQNLLRDIHVGSHTLRI